VLKKIVKISIPLKENQKNFEIEKKNFERIILIKKKEPTYFKMIF
jgi:hypothetical protein